MKRSWMLAVTAAAISALTVTGVALAATRPIPDPKPNTAFQSDVPTPLPGDPDVLQRALNAPSPVKYRVLVIDDTDGEDRTAYLDRMAEKWGMPAADQLYLVLFTQANYDLRFYMGSDFRAKGVTVDEMLTLVRNAYFAKSQKGDVAGGLADLVNAVNQRMGGQATAAPKEPVISVPDTLGDGPRWSAAAEIDLAKNLLTAYLNQYLSEDVPPAQRLKSFRIAEEKIHPLTGDLVQPMLLEMTYDVLPVRDPSAWLAGNGTLGSDGWVTGKLIYLTAVREGNSWRIVSTSTSR